MMDLGMVMRSYLSDGLQRVRMVVALVESLGKTWTWRWYEMVVPVLLRRGLEVRGMTSIGLVGELLLVEVVSKCADDRGEGRLHIQQAFCSALEGEAQCRMAGVGLLAPVQLELGQGAGG